MLGAKSFAVLYPRSRYGRGMRTRYWDAVRERGGRLVAAASYEPDATDFNEPIRSMVGYNLLTENEKVALSERERALRRGRRLEPEDAALLRNVLYKQMGPEAVPLPPLVDFERALHSRLPRQDPADRAAARIPRDRKAAAARLR